MSTSTRPVAASWVCLTRPVNVALNADVGSFGAGAAAATGVATWRAGRASNVFGVPARAAQPAAPGPERYHPPTRSGSASVTTVTVARAAGDVCPRDTRQSTEPP